MRLLRFTQRTREGHDIAHGDASGFLGELVPNTYVRSVPAGVDQRDTVPLLRVLAITERSNLANDVCLPRCCPGHDGRDAVFRLPRWDLHLLDACELCFLAFKADARRWGVEAFGLSSICVTCLYGAPCPAARASSTSPLPSGRQRSRRHRRYACHELRQ